MACQKGVFALNKVLLFLYQLVVRYCYFVLKLVTNEHCMVVARRGRKINSYVACDNHSEALAEAIGLTYQIIIDAPKRDWPVGAEILLDEAAQVREMVLKEKLIQKDFDINTIPGVSTYRSTSAEVRAVQMQDAFCIRGQQHVSHGKKLDYLVRIDGYLIAYNRKKFEELYTRQ